MPRGRARAGLASSDPAEVHLGSDALRAQSVQWLTTTPAIAKAMNARKNGLLGIHIGLRLALAGSILNVTRQAKSAPAQLASGRF
jgi:hypothetical protein